MNQAITCLPAEYAKCKTNEFQFATVAYSKYYGNLRSTIKIKIIYNEIN